VARASVHFGAVVEEDAFGVGHAQFAADDVAREDVAVAIDFRADAPGFAVAAQASGLWFPVSMPEALFE